MPYGPPSESRFARFNRCGLPFRIPFRPFQSVRAPLPNPVSPVSIGAVPPFRIPFRPSQSVRYPPSGSRFARLNRCGTPLPNPVSPVSIGAGSLPSPVRARSQVPFRPFQTVRARSQVPFRPFQTVRARSQVPSQVPFRPFQSVRARPGTFGGIPQLRLLRSCFAYLHARIVSISLRISAAQPIN
jgi:hypothetical protein